MSKKLGATGKFPGGKLNEDDEGELRMAIGINQDNLVQMSFGKPVSWLAMPAENAIQMGRTLIAAAEEALVAARLKN